MRDTEIKPYPLLWGYGTSEPLPTNLKYEVLENTDGDIIYKVTAGALSREDSFWFHPCTELPDWWTMHAYPHYGANFAKIYGANFANQLFKKIYWNKELHMFTKGVNALDEDELYVIETLNRVKNAFEAGKIKHVRMMAAGVIFEENNDQW